MSRAERTLSCLKKQSIRSSLQTLLADTRDWNTFGSFFSATRFPSRGSVTALQFPRTALKFRTFHLISFDSIITQRSSLQGTSQWFPVSFHCNKGIWKRGRQCNPCKSKESVSSQWVGLFTQHQHQHQQHPSPTTSAI